MSSMKADNKEIHSYNGKSIRGYLCNKLDPALWSWGDPKAFAQPEETHFHKWNFVSFSGFVAQKWTPKCRWPGTTTKSVGTPMKFRAFSYTYPRAFSGGRNSSCRTRSPNSLGQVVYIYIWRRKQKFSYRIFELFHKYRLRLDQEGEAEAL